MLTKAVRLYGKNDLRLETFELPQIKDDEILVKVISDSVCMSTYKTAMQGEEHLRVPNDIAENPVIIGHEFCAEIIEVGEKRKDQFSVGEKVIAPPVLTYLGGNRTIGYSFVDVGGCSEYAVIHGHIIDNDFLIKLKTDAFFKGSLIEPASCVLRGFKASNHLDDNLLPVANIKEGGKAIILAGCGPMGLAAIDCILHGDVKPSMVVVTDIDKERLNRAESLFCNKAGNIKLVFSNATTTDELMEISGGTGYDDVFVYAPVSSLIEVADSILAFDGCLNFFAGPMDKKLSAGINFYNIHYAQHHYAGTSGSTPDDMRDIVKLLGEDRIDPAVMITHIGGIDSAIDTTLNLPKIPGGKKIIYTHINLPLTPLTDFEKLSETDERFKVLDKLVKEHNGLWNSEAEKYLLENF